MSIRSVCVLPALTCALMLAGCDKPAQPAPGKAAGADVLPGTISDSMLDLDQSRARPLLQPVPRNPTAATDTASDAPSEAAAADSAAPPPAPAPTN
ncbi:hypothetical protein [Novosphingobium sp. FSW06-99]|uniref:hypothetical protein n=1 Tax=Novosphingobium sp. FSW06-99 TaxID=1739113 RepID=UPI000A71451A|nr:hypothetical protein [Novosphingobium sp. FSW06-99]